MLTQQQQNNNRHQAIYENLSMTLNNMDSSSNSTNYNLNNSMNEYLHYIIIHMALNRGMT